MKSKSTVKRSYSSPSNGWKYEQNIVSIMMTPFVNLVRITVDNYSASDARCDKHFNHPLLGLLLCRLYTTEECRK